MTPKEKSVILSKLRKLETLIIVNNAEDGDALGCLAPDITAIDRFIRDFQNENFHNWLVEKFFRNANKLYKELSNKG